MLDLDHIRSNCISLKAVRIPTTGTGSYKGCPSPTQDHREFVYSMAIARLGLEFFYLVPGLTPAKTRVISSTLTPVKGRLAPAILVAVAMPRRVIIGRQLRGRHSLDV